MLESKIKEKLSLYYFGVLATKAGFNIVPPSDDFGVDLLLKQVDQYEIRGKRRFVESGKMIGIQLKCTTSKEIHVQADSMGFDLPVKNYNDLIWRRNDLKNSHGTHIPLILVLLVLPPDPKKWVSISENLDQLVLTGKAYWLYPYDNMGFSKNRYFQRISIPLNNQILPPFFKTIFQNLFEN